MSDELDEVDVSVSFFTDMCPNCNNQVLLCDGVHELCRCCDYERLWERAPLDSDDEGFHVAGLA